MAAYIICNSLYTGTKSLNVYQIQIPYITVVQSYVIGVFTKTADMRKGMGQIILTLQFLINKKYIRGEFCCLFFIDKDTEAMNHSSMVWLTQSVQDMASKHLLDYHKKFTINIFYLINILKKEILQIIYLQISKLNENLQMYMHFISFQYQKL